MFNTSRYLPYNNLLVTGGAGFIGAHFIHYFLKKYPNIRIVNFDKLTYAAELSHLETVNHLENYVFLQGDICDSASVTNTFLNFNIDAVVHFAAESHVDRSISDADAFINTNIVGTQVLLETCRTLRTQLNFKRFHHVSTDEVYGSLGFEEAPFTEISLYRPNSPYAASKASSDHLVRAYYETYGLPVTWSNCSNNYGLFQHTEKLIPKIIAACLTKQPIPIYGDGKNIRDWLHVDDHCYAIECILTRAPVGQHYNIGADNEWDNLSLTYKICDQVDALCGHKKSSRKLIQFVTDRLGHDQRYAINASKISRELGWKSRVNFDEGLNKLIREKIVSFRAVNQV